MVDNRNAVWVGGFDGGGVSKYEEAKSVEDSQTSGHPLLFGIRGTYPNPFNLSATIDYALSEAGDVSLSVSSITGQKIRTLLSGPLAAGAHSAVWDGKDDSGKTVSSGIYIAHLRSGKLTASRRMALVK
jgi:hypothetical protein